MQFTAIIEQGEDGWLVGQLEEIPEVLSQGRTKEELMNNLRDALEQLFLANKEQMDSEHAGKNVKRAHLKVA
ncbi:MAG TPA: type II toxin-antitoxin system HicB family antitoxin [Flavobacteriales bacterium]|nr:type II toxin-antitoxin system HicB family antitoxin [Flavobacteriales bacterium]